MKTSVKVLITVLSLILVAVFVGIIVYTSLRPTEKAYTEFLEDVKSGNVAEVKISNDTASVYYTGKKKTEYVVYVRDSAIVELINDYNAGKYQKFEIEYEEKEDENGEIIKVPKLDEDGNEVLKPIPFTQIALWLNNRYAVSITDYIVPIIGFIVLVVMMVLMFRMMSNSNKQAMDFGKTKTAKQDQLKVRFSDVAGAEEEKEELKEIVEFLKNPQKFTSVGARVPHGVLLVGPPGTGKTLFAKAVAGEANVPFFSKSGSDFVEMFVGVGASRVRDLFEQAKKNAPCIVFIDEIDAVGRQRGAGMGGGNDEREQTLNQLLVAMDGFESDEHIIVMAATNRSDILDPALMRPGRFDRQIYVNLPDVRGREAILKVHARNKPLASDVDFKKIARLTGGFSGADLENLLNEAAILAARENRTRITMEDMFEGINKVELGPQKRSRLVTPVDQRITAYHEAGHAIVACSIKGSDPVQEVSIIPRGNAGGYTMYRPEDDSSYRSRSKLIGMLAHAMGGRAAEEIIIEDYTSGAVGDIQQATNIARKMVTELGMSNEVGLVYYGGGQEVFLGRDYQTQHSYSEKVAAQIDAEVKRLLDEAHKQALDILTAKRKIMENMARVLLECETIYTEEVEMLMNGASPDEVKAELEERLKYKEAHRNEMEKAPIQKLSDIDPVKKSGATKPPAASTQKTVTLADKTEKKEEAESTDVFDVTYEKPVIKAAAPKKKPIKRVGDDDKTNDGDDTAK